MECSCTVYTEVGDYCELLSSGFVKARKEHKCYECCGTIKVSEEYFKEATVYDRQFTEYKTCEHCYALRQVFFSDGWCYGQLWEAFKGMVRECQGDISVPCILDLTKVGRDKVLDLIEQTWENDEYCPKCEHLIVTTWSSTKCSNKNCDYVEPCL